jgi:hypothetical protein
MAYGIRCKHCELQELDHTGNPGENHDPNCPGYSPEDPKEEVIMHNRFIKGLEHYGRGSELCAGAEERIERNRKKLKIPEPEIQETLVRAGMDNNEIILSLLGKR